MPTPEERARENIDRMLIHAGWILQDRNQMNLSAGSGVAIREFPLKTGEADYLLFVDSKAVGVIEAKPEGTTLRGVSEQTAGYITGLPPEIPHLNLPLPFAYESTGIETLFRDERDPEPRSRLVFSFHQPKTLQEWAQQPQTLRARLKNLPPLITKGLWKAQVEAIANLEQSMANNKTRALIQMATGSGKTYTTVTSLYRLIKFSGIKRALFLVDRNNLGRQTLREFQNYITPDDGRKFSELYNVRRLSTNYLDLSNQVVITTIQRLYSMLKGEPEFDTQNEEGSLFDSAAYTFQQEPMPVVYNPTIPPETFDVIITDECHRSIYNLWRQVLEYFDAFIIGLTATPSKQTFGFFDENLVMEYPRLRAVADGVNVDGHVYRIRTRITQEGSHVDAGFYVDKRNKLTREVRWKKLEDDLDYNPNELDRQVVSKSQIRTIVRTFKDNLFSEIFPGREVVPKILVFAKDDSHAEDIVQIIREEFGKGNEFCKKITYRTTGASPEDLINDFRNSYNPRIAVSVDMITTGTDIRPLEILLFMRAVKSRTYFEQMVGRGTRVINATDLQGVTPDATRKDHFVIIDAVGVVEQEKIDTQTMERKRSLSFAKLLEQVALGIHDEDTLTTLAGRMARLERELTPLDKQKIFSMLTVTAKSAGSERWVINNPPATLGELCHRLLDVYDPDIAIESAQAASGKEKPGQQELTKAHEQLLWEATQVLVEGPKLRNLLANIHQRNEQIVDTVSRDEVIQAGFDDQSARLTIESFKEFIQHNKDEIAALRLLYNQPYGLRDLTFRQIQELSERIQQPPTCLTTEALWRAYAQLEKDKVHGAGARRVLTDLVSLVRHTLQLEDELVPFPYKVRQRYKEWLRAQAKAGTTFTEEQRWWLDRIAERIGVNLKIGMEDFEYGEFFEEGGRIMASRVFGNNLLGLLNDINKVLIK
ncbi:MAG TPA: DEAD/DEAH box helicase family protein [Anaerolineae bacterium]|nr:DEAD/DEAH box helicase family protein [Anaerolineae bacterium]